MPLLPTIVALTALASGGAKPGLTVAQLTANIDKAFARHKRTKETWTFKAGEFVAATIVRTRDGAKHRTEMQGIPLHVGLAFDGVKGYQVDYISGRYMHLTAKEVAELSKQTGPSLGLNAEAIKAMGLRIKSVSSTKLKGRRSRLVTLTNPATSSTVKIWFPTNDWLPKQLEMKDPTMAQPMVASLELRVLPHISPDTFKVPRQVVEDFDLVQFEEFPDGAEKLKSGISIAGELDDKLTKAGWFRWGLAIAVVPTTVEEYKSAARAVESAIDQYPSGFVKKYLDRVWITGEMSTTQMGMGGTYNQRFIYLVTSSDAWVREAFHHEFSSFLLYEHMDKFPKDKWMSLNKTPYLSLMSSQANWSVGSDEMYERGFLKGYGETDFENDFNTVAEAVMTGSIRLSEAEQKHDLIRQKAQIVREFYGTIAPELNEKYFSSLVRTRAWQTDEQPPAVLVEVGDHYQKSVPIERGDDDWFMIDVAYNLDIPHQPYIVLYGEPDETEPLVEQWVARGYAVVTRSVEEEDGNPKPGDEELILKYLQQEHAGDGDLFDSERLIALGVGEGCIEAQDLAKQEAIHSLVLIDPPKDLQATQISKPLLVLGGNKPGQVGFEAERLPLSFWKSPEGDRYAMWALEPYEAKAATMPFLVPASISFLDGFVRGDEMAKSFLVKNKLAAIPLRPALIKR